MAQKCLLSNYGIVIGYYMKLVSFTLSERLPTGLFDLFSDKDAAEKGLWLLKIAHCMCTHDPVRAPLISCGDLWVFGKWENMVFLISSSFHEAQTDISEAIEPWTWLSR